MDLRVLHEFLVLAQTEKYLEAADLLFISQPTLTRHIKNLEDELGVPLFDRSTRHVRLNKYGSILMPYAKQFVELDSQFTDLLQYEKRRHRDQLSIAAIPAMSYYGITDVLSLFRKENPDCPINVIPSYGVSVATQLRQRNCELGFVREQTQGSGDDLIRIPLCSDRLVALFPESHSLAGRESIALSDLRGEAIITLARETLVFDIINSACFRAGFEPQVVLCDHNIDQLIDCVQLGMGVGLFMDRHLSMRSDVRVTEVTPICRSYISLIYLKDAELSKNARSFIEMYEKTAPSRQTCEHALPAEK